MSTLPDNMQAISARYLGGESMRSIADDMGENPKRLKRWLVQAGVPLRTARESRAAGMTRVNIAGRGKRHSPKRRAKQAATRQRREVCTSPNERMMANGLRRLGVETIPQKAIGPYNVDLAVQHCKLAVEIFGGYWHGTGRHAERYRERCDYLLGCGWLPVIVWATREHPLSDAAIEAVAKLAKSGAPERMKERVLRGDGLDATAVASPDSGAIPANPKPCEPA